MVKNTVREAHLTTLNYDVETDTIAKKAEVSSWRDVFQISLGERREYLRKARERDAERKNILAKIASFTKKQADYESVKAHINSLAVDIFNETVQLETEKQRLNQFAEGTSEFKYVTQRIDPKLLHLRYLSTKLTNLFKKLESEGPDNFAATYKEYFSAKPIAEDAVYKDPYSLEIEIVHPATGDWDEISYQMYAALTAYYLPKLRDLHTEESKDVKAQRPSWVSRLLVRFISLPLLPIANDIYNFIFSASVEFDDAQTTRLDIQDHALKNLEQSAAELGVAFGNKYGIGPVIPEEHATGIFDFIHEHGDYKTVKVPIEHHAQLATLAKERLERHIKNTPSIFRQLYNTLRMNGKTQAWIKKKNDLEHLIHDLSLLPANPILALLMHPENGAIFREACVSLICTLKAEAGESTAAINAFKKTASLKDIVEYLNSYKDSNNARLAKEKLVAAIQQFIDTGCGLEPPGFFDFSSTRKAYQAALERSRARLSACIEFLNSSEEPQLPTHFSLVDDNPTVTKVLERFKSLLPEQQQQEIFVANEKHPFPHAIERLLRSEYGDATVKAYYSQVKNRPEVAQYNKLHQPWKDAVKELETEMLQAGQKGAENQAIKTFLSNELELAQKNLKLAPDADKRKARGLVELLTYCQQYLEGTKSCAENLVLRIAANACGDFSDLPELLIHHGLNGQAQPLNGANGSPEDLQKLIPITQCALTTAIHYLQQNEAKCKHVLGGYEQYKTRLKGLQTLLKIICADNLQSISNEDIAAAKDILPRHRLSENSKLTVEEFLTRYVEKSLTDALNDTDHQLNSETVSASMSMYTDFIKRCDDTVAILDNNEENTLDKDDDYIEQEAAKHPIEHRYRTIANDAANYMEYIFMVAPNAEHKFSEQDFNFNLDSLYTVEKKENKYEVITAGFGASRGDIRNAAEEANVAVFILGWGGELPLTIEETWRQMLRSSIYTMHRTLFINYINGYLNGFLNAWLDHGVAIEHLAPEHKLMMIEAYNADCKAHDLKLTKTLACMENIGALSKKQSDYIERIEAVLISYNNMYGHYPLHGLRGYQGRNDFPAFLNNWMEKRLYQAHGTKDNQFIQAVNKQNAALRLAYQQDTAKAEPDTALTSTVICLQQLSAQGVDVSLINLELKSLLAKFGYYPVDRKYENYTSVLWNIAPAAAIGKFVEKLLGSLYIESRVNLSEHPATKKLLDNIITTNDFAKKTHGENAINNVVRNYVGKQHWWHSQTQTYIDMYANNANRQDYRMLRVKELVKQSIDISNSKNQQSAEVVDGFVAVDIELNEQFQLVLSRTALFIERLNKNPIQQKNAQGINTDSVFNDYGRRVLADYFSTVLADPILGSAGWNAALELLFVNFANDIQREQLQLNRFEDLFNRKATPHVSLEITQFIEYLAIKGVDVFASYDATTGEYSTLNKKFIAAGKFQFTNVANDGQENQKGQQRVKKLFDTYITSITGANLLAITDFSSAIWKGMGSSYEKICNKIRQGSVDIAVGNIAAVEVWQQAEVEKQGLFSLDKWQAIADAIEHHFNGFDDNNIINGLANAEKLADTFADSETVAALRMVKIIALLLQNNLEASNAYIQLLLDKNGLTPYEKIIVDAIFSWYMKKGLPWHENAAKLIDAYGSEAARESYFVLRLKKHLVEGNAILSEGLVLTLEERQQQGNPENSHYYGEAFQLKPIVSTQAGKKALYNLLDEFANKGSWNHNTNLFIQQYAACAAIVDTSRGHKDKSPTIMKDGQNLIYDYNLKRFTEIFCGLGHKLDYAVNNPEFPLAAKSRQRFARSETQEVYHGEQEGSWSTKKVEAMFGESPINGQTSNNIKAIIELFAEQLAKATKYGGLEKLPRADEIVCLLSNVFVKNFHTLCEPHSAEERVCEQLQAQWMLIKKKYALLKNIRGQSAEVRSNIRDGEYDAVIKVLKSTKSSGLNEQKGGNKSGQFVQEHIIFSIENTVVELVRGLEGYRREPKYTILPILAQLLLALVEAKEADAKMQHSEVVGAIERAANEHAFKVCLERVQHLLNNAVQSNAEIEALNAAIRSRVSIQEKISLIGQYLGDIELSEYSSYKLRSALYVLKESHKTHAAMISFLEQDEGLFVRVPEAKMYVSLIPWSEHQDYIPAVKDYINGCERISNNEDHETHKAFANQAVELINLQTRLAISKWVTSASKCNLNLWFDTKLVNQLHELARGQYRDVAKIRNVVGKIVDTFGNNFLWDMLATFNIKSANMQKLIQSLPESAIIGLVQHLTALIPQLSEYENKSDKGKVLTVRSKRIIRTEIMPKLMAEAIGAVLQETIDKKVQKIGPLAVSTELRAKLRQVADVCETHMFKDVVEQLRDLDESAEVEIIINKINEEVVPFFSKPRANGNSNTSKVIVTTSKNELVSPASSFGSSQGSSSQVGSLTYVPIPGAAQALINTIKVNYKQIGKSYLAIEYALKSLKQGITNALELGDLTFKDLQLLYDGVDEGSKRALVKIVHDIIMNLAPAEMRQAVFEGSLSIDGLITRLAPHNFLVAQLNCLLDIINFNYVTEVEWNHQVDIVSRYAKYITLLEGAISYIKAGSPAGINHDAGEPVTIANILRTFATLPLAGVFAQASLPALAELAEAKEYNDLAILIQQFINTLKANEQWTQLDEWRQALDEQVKIIEEVENSIISYNQIKWVANLYKNDLLNEKDIVTDKMVNEAQANHLSSLGTAGYVNRFDTLVEIADSVLTKANGIQTPKNIAPILSVINPAKLQARQYEVLAALYRVNEKSLVDNPNTSLGPLLTCQQINQYLDLTSKLGFSIKDLEDEFTTTIDKLHTKVSSLLEDAKVPQLGADNILASMQELVERQGSFEQRTLHATLQQNYREAYNNKAIEMGTKLVEQLSLNYADVKTIHIFLTLLVRFADAATLETQSDIFNNIVIPHSLKTLKEQAGYDFLQDIKNRIAATNDSVALKDAELRTKNTMQVLLDNLGNTANYAIPEDAVKGYPTTGIFNERDFATKQQIITYLLQSYLQLQVWGDAATVATVNKALQKFISKYLTKAETLKGGVFACYIITYLGTDEQFEQAYRNNAFVRDYKMLNFSRHGLLTDNEQFVLVKGWQKGKEFFNKGRRLLNGNSATVTDSSASSNVPVAHTISSPANLGAQASTPSTIMPGYVDGASGSRSRVPSPPMTIISPPAASKPIEFGKGGGHPEDSYGLGSNPSQSSHHSGFFGQFGAGKDWSDYNNHFVDSRHSSTDVRLQQPLAEEQHELVVEAKRPEAQDNHGKPIDGFTNAFTDDLSSYLPSAGLQSKAKLLRGSRANLSSTDTTPTATPALSTVVGFKIEKRT